MLTRYQENWAKHNIGSRFNPIKSSIDPFRPSKETNLWQVWLGRTEYGRYDGKHHVLGPRSGSHRLGILLPRIDCDCLGADLADLHVSTSRRHHTVAVVSGVYPALGGECAGVVGYHVSHEELWSSKERGTEWPIQPTASRRGGRRGRRTRWIAGIIAKSHFQATARHQPVCTLHSLLPMDPIPGLYRFATGSCDKVEDDPCVYTLLRLWTRQHTQQRQKGLAFEEHSHCANDSHLAATDLWWQQGIVGRCVYTRLLLGPVLCIQAVETVQGVCQLPSTTGSTTGPNAGHDSIHCVRHPSCLVLHCAGADYPSLGWIVAYQTRADPDSRLYHSGDRAVLYRMLLPLHADCVIAACRRRRGKSTSRLIPTAATCALQQTHHRQLKRNKPWQHYTLWGWCCTCRSPSPQRHFIIINCR